MSTADQERANGSDAQPDAVAAEPLGERFREPRLPKVLMYALLVLMAAGDAYGIYQTLLSVIRTDTDLVRVFTTALVTGAVLGAHEIGRLTRSRREGRGGHPLWIATIALAWSTVGAGIAWLRITHPISHNGTAGLESLQVGVLLVGLYLLTGVLATTTAYRYGSPAGNELRALMRRRDRRERHAADLRAAARSARATSEQVREERDRLSTTAGADRTRTYGAYLRDLARYRQAEYLGNPQQTDELLPRPSPPPRDPDT